MMSESESISFIEDLVDDYYKVQLMILPDEPSTAQNVTSHLTKMLLLTCASYYEQQLQNAFISYAKKEADKYAEKPHGFDLYKGRDKSIYQKFTFGRIETPDDNNQLPELKNLLNPLCFFGEKFREKIYNEIKDDSDKEKEAKAFQEIFVIRNLIAHNTFVELNSNVIRGKSFMDIKQLHDDALKFVNFLISQFKW